MSSAVMIASFEEYFALALVAGRQKHGSLILRLFYIRRICLLVRGNFN